MTQQDSSTEEVASDNSGESESLQQAGLLGALGRMFSPTGSSAPWRAVRAAFNALDNVDFRWLWIGGLASNIGTWMQNVAKQWLIYDISGSEFWLGVDAMCVQLPMVMLLPIAGVLADRLDRRRMLMTIQYVMAILAAGLAVLSYVDHLTIWAMLITSVGLGICNALTVPAFQSLLPELVRKEQLANAVALNSMNFNLSRAIGPAIGGLSLTLLGATWSFGVNSLSFAFIIIGLARLRIKPHRKTSVESVWHSLREGFTYLRSRADLVTMEAMMFCLAFHSGPAVTMLPALTKVAYHGGEAEFSWMLSSFGFGAMIGALLLAARSAGKPRPWRALPLLMIFGVSQITMGMGISLWLAYFCSAVTGACFVGVANRLFAVVLNSTPSELRGRTSSYHILMIVLGIPAGSMVAAGLTEVMSLQEVYVFFGFMLMGWSVVLVSMVRRTIRRAEAQVATEQE